MAITRLVRRRILGLVGVGVALPALALAALGIFLTLRISREIQSESARYNTYLAQKVAEAFEHELMAHLRRLVVAAENAARAGEGAEALLPTLATGEREFGERQFVPIETLEKYSMRVVESQLLVFGPDPTSRRREWFAGVMLRGREGQVIGAGGWWFDPRVFLTRNLPNVVQERLLQSPVMYGDIESTRKLSIQIFDHGGVEVGRVRDPGRAGTERSVPMSGPFEDFTIRVSATSSAPVVWAGRFVAIEVTFIALMGMVIIIATFFGLRYTSRQIELAQIKSSFVANVSHELKTPIALIRLAVETLEMRRVSSPAETEKFLRSISREAQRLNYLVDNILDFARLEARQRSFRFIAVDLGEVIRDAVESFRPRLDEQGFKLEVEVPDDLPPVRGDATALNHCLLNLLDNAVKYSRQRREIELRAGVRDGTATVSVSDHGIGIEPADQKRIFEKFVRLETGLVHDVKGAGLGLSLVDQIIRAHGGRVEVESSPGEGSTFTLVLPLAEAAGEAADAPHTEPRARTAS